MPLLKMPKELTDGGYAVSAYDKIDERFGNMYEFEKILDLFREAGISICLDFVINHTSKEHKWALIAKKGIPEYENMYFIYNTDDIPKIFEKTVPEVFPKVSPGNFTYYSDIDKYVMTSFYGFQWDLNYHNPIVFNEIAKSILNLANKGVEIFILDAIPFMWKELGTTCRNLPKIHTLVQTYKLISKIVCPGVIFKGEAIVSPDEILSYFGGLEGKECHAMYNA
jgi:amylosucrase